MTRFLTTGAAAAFLVAAGSMASAQTISPECVTSAANAGLDASHNVIFDPERTACIATPLGDPMFGTPGFVAGGTAAGVGAGVGAGVAGLGTAGGVLAAAGLVTVVAVASTGGT